MVVGDHDVEAERAGHLDLGNVADAAVAGDDEGHAVVGEVPQPGLGQPVPLGQPRGHVPPRIGSQPPERDDPGDDRGHPVRVVVTPDRDPLAGGERRIYPVERDIRIGHASKVVEGAGAGRQEPLELRVVREASPGQERGNRTSEAGEAGRVRDGLREDPLEARDDHTGMVVRATPPPLTVWLLGPSAPRGPPCGARPTRSRPPGSARR